MTQRALFTVLASLFIICSCQHSGPADREGPTLDPFSGGKWIDLSYTYDENTIYWPTADGFHLDTAFEGHTEGGYYYSAFNISTAEHGGTHMDAPIHFAEGAQSTDQLRLDQLTGYAAIIDVTAKASVNPDYLISVEDLTAWEADHGKLPEGMMILFRTGHGKYWPDAKKYLGTTKKGNEGVAELHFPGISPELAQWLIDNREVKAIGIDTPSIDYGQSKDFMTHRILFADNIPAFENVANLDQLTDPFVYIVALPMKIKGGSGGPVRIAAFVDSSFSDALKAKFIEN